MQFHGIWHASRVCGTDAGCQILAMDFGHGVMDGLDMMYTKFRNGQMSGLGQVGQELDFGAYKQSVPTHADSKL